jgi:hypothetical protein
MERPTGQLWALDNVGCELRVDDRVWHEWPIGSGAHYPFTIDSFLGPNADQSTGQVADDSRCVMLLSDNKIDGHRRPVLTYPTHCKRWFPDDDPMGKSYVDPMVANLKPGSVVGVLGCGPIELQGRVGEVTRMGYSNADGPHGPSGTLLAVEVMTDDRVRAWCEPSTIARVFDDDGMARIAQLFTGWD